MKKKQVRHQVDSKIVKKKKGLFSKETVEVEKPIYTYRDELVPTGKYSDTAIDMEDLAVRVTESCNDLYERGFEVENIISTIEGRYGYNTNIAPSGGGGWGYGYGYSVTDGVVILAKRKSP